MRDVCVSVVSCLHVGVCMLSQLFLVLCVCVCVYLIQIHLFVSVCTLPGLCLGVSCECDV